MIAVAGTVLVGAGTVVLLLAALGLLRLGDAYTRASAVATGSGTGISLIVLGVALYDLTPTNAVLAVAAVVLQLCTSGVAGTVLGRSALLTGHEFVEGTDTSALDPPAPEQGSAEQGSAGQGSAGQGSAGQGSAGGIER